MKWSLKIARIAGINIYLHWTFLILLAWIAVAFYVVGDGLTSALRGVGFIAAVFTCVVLHELGHALTAKRYDVPTRDITLLPIGGLARMQRIPEQPKAELLIAVAGPLVNVVIAAVLLGIVLSMGITPYWPESMIGGSFLVNLMWVNTILVVFNLLPAFPMDGGRVLRALLAMRMNYMQATEIAANTGQAMAVLFAIAGLFFNWFLLFIALFVYMGAAAEARMVQMRTLVEGVPVGDAMITRFESLGVDESLGDAVKELLAGSQQDFPVVEDGQLRGILRRRDLVQALHQEEGKTVRVADVMSTECQSADQREMLDSVVPRMRESDCGSIPVVDKNRVVGMLTLENVGELLMIRSAMGNGRKPADEAEVARNVAAPP